MILPQSKENEILFVKNLPYNVTDEELYALFSQFGNIRQIRLGETASNTRGTAYVVYTTVDESRKAYETLSGYNFQNRYLIVHYFDLKRIDSSSIEERRKKLEELKNQHDIE